MILSPPSGTSYKSSMLSTHDGDLLLEEVSGSLLSSFILAPAQAQVSLSSFSLFFYHRQLTDSAWRSGHFSRI